MGASLPGTWWDRVFDWVFLVGVLGKAVDGLVESVAGVAALLVTHAQIVGLVHALTADELAEEPHALIANLVVAESARLGSRALLAGGVYLLVHGVVKLAIVVALGVGSRRVYPWAVGALTALLVLQVAELALRFSAGVLILSVLDVAVIGITVREWRHGRVLHDVISARMPRLGRRVAGGHSL